LTAEKARGFFAVMRSPRPLAALSAAFFSSLSLGAVAAPPAGNADQLLAELEADKAHQSALAPPLQKAKDALGRAHSMDQVGDGPHANLLRAVAREWLDLAKDLARTADAEAKAEQREKALDDLETKIVRGRALLEETIARRARAEALLEEVDRAAPTTTTAAVPEKDKGKPGAGPAVKPSLPSSKAPPGAAPVPPPAAVPQPQSSPASPPPGATAPKAPRAPGPTPGGHGE
jgi:hypothetical protein